MAQTYRAIFTFKDTSGSTISHRYSYAKNQEDFTSTIANNYMDAAISNKEIFVKQPAEKVKAELEITELVQINLEDTGS